MCGIVACRGPCPGGMALDALRHLEYRGYDSAGIAVSIDGALAVQRSVGKLANLIAQVDGDQRALSLRRGIGIGHTRWATHGRVSLENAHPLTDCSGRIALVHNGIVSNAQALRAELELSGHSFAAQVDSEVIAHLVEAELATGSVPFDALRKALARLEGSWAIALLVRGFDGVLVARHRSPLLVRGDRNRFIVASDAGATTDIAGPLRVLDDGDVVELGRIWRWSGGRGDGVIPPAVEEPAARPPAAAAPEGRGPGDAAEEAGSAMSREISEQRELVAGLVADVVDRLERRVAVGRAWDELGVPLPRSVLLLACGSSFHAAQVIARALSVIAGIRASAVIASEYEPVLAGEAELIVAISQSGETADVLAALDLTSGPLIAITNNAWSALARRADAVLDCAAGPELGVAATKSFTAQVIVGIGLAAAAALAGRHERNALVALTRLQALPGQFAATMAHSGMVAGALAAELADAPGWLFLGCGSALPYAAEGALKLKEISYRWAQAYPAGELKHGPLALVEPGVPVVVIDNGEARLDTAVAEVRARGARVVLVGGPHSELSPSGAADRAPWGPLASVVALQHLARELGLQLGRDVDRPRNLAKSVTVR